MNLEAFLKEILDPVVDNPEELHIEVKEEGRKRDISIHAEVKDRGRIIGKNGRMISSLRTLCQVAGEKSGLKVNLEVFEEESEKRGHRNREEAPRPTSAPVSSTDEQP